MQTSTDLYLTCLRLNLMVHIKTMWFSTFYTTLSSLIDRISGKVGVVGKNIKH